MIPVLESDFSLKDGAIVHIRPIRPEDDQALMEIFNRSSPQTVYQRFFSPLPELTPTMARYLSHVDYSDRLALVAEAAAGPREVTPVGVGRYERTNDPGLVEFGLVIVDEWQNRGLGRILVREIMRAAERNGIHRFRADVLAENRRMLRLLATEAEIQERRTEAGVATVLFTSRRTGTG